MVTLVSCEKSISIKLDSASPSLVVEASIEDGQPPYVVLSSSFDYFSEISPEILANSFIHNAIIRISDGTKTHQLREYSYHPSPGISLYYYSIDSSQLATAVIGAYYGKYSLEIQSGGKTYKAQTSIPYPARTLDSIWWKPAPANPDTSKVVLVAKITDPPGLGNYTRYYTRVNGGNFYPGLNSVIDDQIVDGKTFLVDVEKGVDRNTKIDVANYSFFNRGDTITMKYSNIDRATYDFWRTMEFTYASIGNPFSSPTKVLGNIPGALGYFGGYSNQYKTLIVPK
jgi:hypothetical protein